MLEQRLIWALIGLASLGVVGLEAGTPNPGTMQAIGFCVGVAVLGLALFRNWKLYRRRRKKPR